MKHCAAFALAFGILAAHRIAAADEGGPPAAEAKGSQPHRHDTLYLQLSAGGGYAHDDLKYEGIFGFAAFTGQGQGASVLFDARGGYAVKPGLIVGGGVFVEQVANPKVTFAGKDVSSDVSVGTLVLFGPLIDWYPSAEGGFHLGGAIGGSRITMKDKNEQKLDNQPIGAGGVFFIGYDFWVADEWSLGLELRSTGATMYDSTSNVRHTWGSGGLLVTVVYN